MKRKCKNIYIVVILALLLTSCGGGYSHTEIIGEPKLNAKFDGIISALRNEGKGITFPLDSKSSSITPISMEKGKKLYMVSYVNYKKMKDGKNIYGLAFFQKKDDKWVKDRDIQVGEGLGLNRIRVSDLDGDDVCEVCVNTYSRDNAILRVFSFDDDFFKDYGLMRVKDYRIDENINDQKKSIVTIVNKEDESEISVMQVVDGRIKRRSSATVGNLHKNNRIELGEITEDEIGIYVFSNSDKVHDNLNFLKVKDGIIENVLNKDAIGELIQNEKIVKLRGMKDINGNGKKEVCYESDSKKYDKESLPIFKYMDITDSSNMYIAERIYENEGYGFSVRLPKEYGDEIMVKSSIHESEPGEHYLFSSISESTEERLFKIICFNKGSEGEMSSKDYKLGENNMYSFYLRVLDKSIIKDETVKSRFETK